MNDTHSGASFDEARAKELFLAALRQELLRDRDLLQAALAAGEPVAAKLETIEYLLSWFAPANGAFQKLGG